MVKADINNKELYIIHTDGGSRGNPGPSAIGVVIADYDGSLKKEYSEYIGETTNNEAEYQAIIFALKKLKQLIGKEKASNAKLEFHVDSELAVKQLNGEYKLNDKNIQRFFIEIWNNKLDYGEVTFKHVPREDNKEADKLVNAALDKELNKLF
ncbi:MAG: ribonuclease HI family protein [bacterium]|nr:ribonuclease HI family protein [bacterium]